MRAFVCVYIYIDVCVCMWMDVSTYVCYVC